MRLLAALAAFLALAFAQPAAAVIAANSIGTANTGSSSVNAVITLTGSPVAGRFTAVSINTWSGATTVTCTDNGSGGVWATKAVYNGGSGGGKLWLCSGTLGTGATTITISNGTTTPIVAASAQFTNIAASPIDATGDSAGAQGASAGGGSDTTGTLAQADELLIGYAANGSGSLITGFTPGSGWTALTGAQEAFGNYGIQWAWKETAATTAVTWSPTWTPNESWAIKIYAFKASVAGAAATGAGLLLGVGE